MKYKSAWFFSVVLGFALLGNSPCAAETGKGRWTFVVLGDTRDKVRNTRTGISPELAGMGEAIALEKPDLVIHTGDLCNGYHTTKDSPMHGKFKEMFRNWKAAVRPIYDYDRKSGIPIYPVRGNHEDGKYVTDPKLKKAYEEEFAAVLPQNGPEDQKGLTYRLTHKRARFVALDEYHQKRWAVFRGYVDLKWLQKELAGDVKPFTFVFSHTPAYRVGNYHASPFPDFYSYAKHRDKIWRLLNGARTTAFFCGHIHLYCRGTVGGIEQVVIGNGGADTVSFDPREVDPAVRIHYPKEPVNGNDVRTGYLLMTVDEDAGTVTGVQKLWNAKKGVWEEDGDRFALKGIL